MHLFVTPQLVVHRNESGGCFRQPALAALRVNVNHCLTDLRRNLHMHVDVLLKRPWEMSMLFPKISFMTCGTCTSSPCFPERRAGMEWPRHPQGSPSRRASVSSITFAMLSTGGLRLLLDVCVGPRNRRSLSHLLHFEQPHSSPRSAP